MASGKGIRKGYGKYGRESSVYVPLMVSLLSSSTRLMSWSKPFSMPLTGGKGGREGGREGWM